MQTRAARCRSRQLSVFLKAEHPNSLGTGNCSGAAAKFPVQQALGKLSCAWNREFAHAEQRALRAEQPGASPGRVWDKLRLIPVPAIMCRAWHRIAAFF